MKVRAYAKINLGLDVKGKREDGYHDLDMINAPVTFYDEIDIAIDDKMSFFSTREYVKNDPKNSILKAVAILRKRYGFKENFKIALRKNIPSRAGLGGGSADAAATIKAIDKLLDLDMDLADYREVAMQIGSDEYYCLFERCARVLGTGDIVKPFQNRIRCHILLVKPYMGISTSVAFSNLDLKVCDHPDISKIQKAMMDGDYQGLCKAMGNSLEEPSLRLNSEIKTIKDELLKQGFDAACMSGSGSTVIGLTKDIDTFEAVASMMRDKRYYVRKVAFLEGPIDMLNR